MLDKSIRCTPQKEVRNRGITQNERVFTALGGSYVQLDERSFPDLLQFAVGFASLVRFYDTSNRADGDWLDFFLNDPPLFFAYANSLNLAQLEAEFQLCVDQTIQSGSFESKFNGFSGTFKIILIIARWMDNLLTGLETVHKNGQIRILSRQITIAVQNRLSKELQRLVDLDLGAGKAVALNRAVGLNYEGFNDIWLMNCVRPASSSYVGENKRAKIDAVLKETRTIFRHFLEAAKQIQANGAKNLSSTLEDGGHNPHTALYLAFAKEMFPEPLKQLNSFTGRYLDFYYQDILRQKPRKMVADRLFLTFILEEDSQAKNQVVPKNSRFLAGQDSPS
ncbi:MAG: hypothetical protein HQL69_22760 [Magnetococcales bacterium]|nr:hypothetical protein [Magnetococcales bacterium]